MDVPYGFDCYTFRDFEVKLFSPNLSSARSFGQVAAEPLHAAVQRGQEAYVRFTRKNEFYPGEQVQALARAGRLNLTEIGGQIFCGIKIQIGIGVVTNFLRMAMQYRRPNSGKSLLINGTWDGIVSGLTVHPDAHNSYDMAFGNFLAYDEEFPYLKFGPFFALESKLVILSGSSRGVVASSFGTNVQGKIWLAVLSFLLFISLLAGLRMRWQRKKEADLERILEQLMLGAGETPAPAVSIEPISLGSLLAEFFFIYFTMLLNKPSMEFDELIWPKHRQPVEHTKSAAYQQQDARESYYRKLLGLPENNPGRRKRYVLATSIRALSYLWSATCFVMASIYSGEMLAVMLLDTDHNIDTIPQLIAARPPIEPVIRQDDFTYNLMRKSLDANMIALQNMTKVIPRPEVYTRRFIERVAERKQALIGDDELIDTIYEIYHKQFPLHRSKVNYLQYPISIMYRKDLNATLERHLRRGMVQIFEMGLIQRWYQAQKDTYIQFYDTYEKKMYDQGSDRVTVASSDKYKPLSMDHFSSFFHLMALCILLSVVVLVSEILHHKSREKSAT